MTEDQQAIDLMLRVSRGDLEAFERLYERYGRPILNYFYRLTWDHPTSEDMMQEVFVKVWKAAPRYRPIGKFTTWLFQIAKNHWLNDLDRRRRRPAVRSLDAFRSDDDARGSHDVAWAGRGPDAEAQDGELRRRIREGVESLSPKLREVYVRAEVEGWAYQAISDDLGIPVGTVKSRMFHAERALRKYLTSEWNERTR